MFMYSNVCTRVNVYLMVLVFIFLFYLWKISSYILMHLNCIHLIICYSGRFKVSGFSTLCFFTLFQYQILGLFSLLSKWAWFYFFFITFYTCILVCCIFYSSYEFNCSQEKFKGLKGPNITNSGTYCQLELPQHFLSTENKTEQITILLLLIIYDNYSKYIKSHQHYFDVTRRKRHILFNIDFPISPLLFFDCFK